MATALVGLLGAAMRPGRSQKDTKTTVRLVANLFVVMTSLVLGLMMNSAKNTLETDNRNVHAPATDLIVLDRTMRALGSQAGEARQHLVEYAVGTSLRAMQLSGDQQVSLWSDARLLYRQVVQQRWVVVDQSGGTIPPPLIAMLNIWLMVIFASLAIRRRAIGSWRVHSL
jgi:hypothetical protein